MPSSNRFNEVALSPSNRSKRRNRVLALALFLANANIERFGDRQCRTVVRSLALTGLRSLFSRTQYSQESRDQLVKFFKESGLILVEAAERLSLSQG